MELKGFIKKHYDDMSYGELIEFAEAVKQIGVYGERIVAIVKEYDEQDLMQINDAILFTDMVKAQISNIQSEIKIIREYGKMYGEND